MNYRTVLFVTVCIRFLMFSGWCINANESALHIQENSAEKYGNLIEKEEDKALFMSDLQGGNWHEIL